MFFRVREVNPVQTDSDTIGDVFTVEWSKEGGDAWETVLTDQLYVRHDESASDVINARAEMLENPPKSERQHDVEIGVELPTQAEARRQGKGKGPQ